MYTKIKLIYGDFPYKQKGSELVYSVIGIDADGNETNITTNPQLTVQSLDANIVLHNGKLYFQKTGSGIVKAYLLQNSSYIFDQVQFVVYDSFFKDNYLLHLLSDFEAQAVEKNTQLKAIMDTCMEYLDIASAFNSDTQLMNDPVKIKSKYLYELGKSMGFDGFENEIIDTPLELQTNNMYRELLLNLYDLLRIRGTKSAYKLFFGALGYDVDIDEFWWDDESNLIEINPNDFLVSTINPTGIQLSSFFAYTQDGNFVDSPPAPRKDPRRFAAPTNDWNKNSKSNYIRPKISVRDELGDGVIVQNPAAFSPKKRAIIKKFLEFLKPQHLQYLQELIVVNFETSNASETISKPFENFSISDLFFKEFTPSAEVFKINEDLFQNNTGKTIGETTDIFLKWDSKKTVNGVKVPRKWDEANTTWDMRELFFEQFTAQKT